MALKLWPTRRTVESHSRAPDRERRLRCFFGLSDMAINGDWAPVAIPPESDQQAKRRARSVAEAGAHHARDRGLDAEARLEEATAAPWRTIVDAADGEYDLIVMGTRAMLREAARGMGVSSARGPHPRQSFSGRVVA